MSMYSFSPPSKKKAFQRFVNISTRCSSFRMKVNLDLSLIQSDDTIIVANNRQVLAIKQSLSEQHGSLKMPNIFSYTSWLQNYWQQNNPKRSIRLLSQMELRFFFKEIIQQDSINQSEVVIDELIKCYHLCKTHFILSLIHI